MLRNGNKHTQQTQVLKERCFSESKLMRESVTLVSMNVAKFLVPDWGEIVDSGIGLSYRQARLHVLAGRYDNLTIFPSKGLRIWLHWLLLP
jgi:hypothetical protein